MLAAPYVSIMAFKAHPTYLDLDDLRSGSSSEGDQDAELANILLMASDWCDNYAEQQLGAHQVVQNCRGRIDRTGALKLHLDESPYLALTQLGYGYTPTSLTVLASPPVWVQNNNLAVTIGGGSGPWSGSLQFGAGAPGSELYVQVAYTAGWVGTQLSAASIAGATSVTVADPTGIVPGGRYRIWDPGAEETVTVSTSWVPPALTVPASPPAPTAVTLASATAFAHSAGHDFSGWPSELRLAVINYAISQLMRPDTSAEDAYPDTHMASGTRQADSRQDGSGLVAESERVLERFRRVR